MEYITAKEVAQCIGVTEKTVWKWARTGVIPCRRFGRKVMFSMDEIEEASRKEKNSD